MHDSSSRQQLVVLGMTLKISPSWSCSVVFDVVCTLPTGADAHISVHARHAHACGTSVRKPTLLGLHARQAQHCRPTKDEAISICR